jgi:hypothetical protein
MASGSCPSSITFLPLASRQKEKTRSQARLPNEMFRWWAPGVLWLGQCGGCFSGAAIWILGTPSPASETQSPSKRCSCGSQTTHLADFWHRRRTLDELERSNSAGEEPAQFYARKARFRP